MTTQIRFFIEGEPRSTQTGSVVRPGGKYATPLRMNPRWIAWAKLKAQEAMRELGCKPLEGFVSLGFALLMPRLKNMKKAGPYPKGGPDLDNALKGLQDAWQGVLYVKDKQIVRYHQLEKVWAMEGQEPGVSVSLYPLEGFNG
jgi:Holliday junction resolvase RusA-like endonuclease